MKATDTSLLDLFGGVRTDTQTLSQSKKVKQPSSSAKRKQTQSVSCNYTEVERSKSSVQNSYCCKIGEIDRSHIPCGNYLGSLPDVILIDGVHWYCSKTMVKDGTTYDMIISTKTREKKKVERTKLLNFLIKNQSKL